MYAVFDCRCYEVTFIGIFDETEVERYFNAGFYTICPVTLNDITNRLIYME